MRFAVACLIAASAWAGPTARVLTAELEVNAPVEKAWSAWTTEAGVKTFFAPGCKVEPHVDGAYDILFNPAGKPGERGAEGMRILGFEPMRRFAFTWNAPPNLPDIRGQRSLVIVEFEPMAEKRTKVRFTQTGWGEGASWDKAYEYFDAAWRAIVLPRFRHAMEVGPIDFENVPQLAPVVKSMKVTLAQ